METLQVKTDIHCERCVDKLAPHFDNSENISHWNVDIQGPDNLLTVKGNNITAAQVSALLGKEGYEVTPLEVEHQAESSFWTNKHHWKRASFNTFSCLVGCSIGDFGMILFLQAYYPDTSMAWQMILAVIAGLFTSILLETFILKVREKFDWTMALKTAFGMSFISMVGMEIAMNTTDFIITGGKAAFDDPMYWTALFIALVAGFIAPLPYNYYKLQKFNKACH